HSFSVCVLRPPSGSTLFPYTTLFRSGAVSFGDVVIGEDAAGGNALTADRLTARLRFFPLLIGQIQVSDVTLVRPTVNVIVETNGDRKSTRLNSSHVAISYAVFCLKKK